MANSIERLRRLAPLIGVLSFVAVSTATVSFVRAEYAAMEVGKTFMAMFFLTFGGFKVYNLEGFVEAFQEYDFLAARSNVYAWIYPFLETGLGLMYVITLFYSSLGLEVIAYVSTILLMSIGGTGVLHALLNGRNLQCACLGNVFNVPMTEVTLAEDLGMAVIAAVMLVATV